MLARIVLFTTIALGLVACSSNLNPFNWFSRGEETVALYPDGGFPDDNDQRLTVPQVTDLQVLRASGGAIIRATGLPPRLGYWDGELVAENDEYPVDGVLTYVFKIAEPREATSESTPYARKVFIAHFVSDTRLAGVRSIQVMGAENSRSARR